MDHVQEDIKATTFTFPVKSQEQLGYFNVV